MRYRKTSQTEHALLPFITILLLAIMMSGLLYMMQRGGTEPTRISLRQGNIKVTGKGAIEDGNIVIIKQGGRYLIEGSLEDGRIYVDIGEEEKVLLELTGVDIGNPSGAVIHVECAEHTEILLAAGTENRIWSGAKPDGQANEADDGEEEKVQGDGAAIYAEDDLFISGEGSLQVSGGLNNGIQSKANLRIESGNIEVCAVNNGIKGKDSVTISGGNLR